MQVSAPQRRRSNHKHAAILHAAAALVGEQGYSATTIEKIAATAGVGKQTIYRWWPSKAALFVEVYTDLVSAVSPPGGRGGCQQDLSRFLAALFRHYTHSHAGLILQGLLGEMANDAVAREAVTQGLLLQRESVLREAIARGIKTGEIKSDIPASDIANTIVALVWQQLLLDHRKLNTRMARHIVRVATNAS